MPPYFRDHMNVLPQTPRLWLREFLSRHSWSLSQAGQDQWIFGEAFNERLGGFFLDIGAHDGICISNTYTLEHRYQWKGLCIEANPLTFETLRKNRRATCINVCLDSVAGEVDFVMRGVLGGIVAPDLDNTTVEQPNSVIRINAKPLIDVLKEHGAPRLIDYLSMDVEGAEERILKEFDFDQYRFNCMTIERPTQTLRQVLSSNGYILVKDIVGLDCFYVHADYLATYKKNLFRFHQKRHFVLRWM